MKRSQPTPVEGKPKADIRIKKRRRPAVPEFDYGDGNPPTDIDLLNSDLCWDTTDYPYDILGGDYEDTFTVTTEYKYLKCLICDQIGKHTTPCCPYLEFVPHDVTLPPGIDRLCRCCDKIGGHPGQEWVGYAHPMRCDDCYIKGEHRTGDPDCPAKAAPTETGTPSETAPTETWKREKAL